MLKTFLNILSKDCEKANEKAQVGISKLNRKNEVIVGSYKVHIVQKIAEGGYADIY